MRASDWFDRLVPRVCLDCELNVRAPFDLCEHCTAALPWNAPACPRCALPVPGPGGACPACARKPPPFEHTFAPLRYGAPITGWVHAAKFRASPVHVATLTALFDLAFDRSASLPDALVPVPLSRRRLFARGHNQAQLLAVRIGRRLGVPVAAGLARRIRHTPPQQGLDRRARLANLDGAFAVRGAPPAHVAIVDDVLTTGATCTELALTLLAAGSERVEVWAIARASLDH